ncbi:hypothetical protein Q4S45_13730 [Massilia sp. R2A-15]|uniref:hypothetical protein n=1 Tax=Massilia sp. R2A-15 TaxID=3064278 RepID=UPI0027376B01|nr:hypothetical protein [Massilia sp. R2A-15]WLI87796.1 hypothetical protein Q4S45_13730 [Massilia sp. R2A-15]
MLDFTIDYLTRSDAGPAASAPAVFKPRATTDRRAAPAGPSPCLSHRRRRNDKLYPGTPMSST